MIRLLRNIRREASLFVMFTFICQVFLPATSYALTSGPTQPEVQAFQPAGTSDMVDMFTGDFSYNIPLFELPGPNGGYPFNLSYQSGSGMDTEASWVGLGFSLNPGAITRQMRGLPDEFKGDPVHTKMSIDPSVTVGLGVGVSLEVFGASAEIGSIGLGVTHNSYKGVGYSIDASLGYKMAAGGGMTAGVGLDLSLNSKEGVNVNPSLSLGGKMGEFGLGAGYNSKQGLSTVSFTHSIDASRMLKYSVGDKVKAGMANSSASLTLAHPGYTPQVSMPMRNVSISAQFKPGGSWWGFFANGYIRGFYSEQWLHNDKKRIRSDAYGYMHYDQGMHDSKSVLDFNREKDGIVTKESPNLSIPSLTYDIYTVAGQGIAAMYRPLRNDYGVVRDPETSSVSVGGSIGVDVGPAASHVGVNLSVNHSKSTSGGWDGNNDIGSRAAFQQKNLNDTYEPWYFKVHGEPSAEPAETLNALGGTGAVRVRLTGNNINPTASSTVEGQTGARSIPSSAATNRERKARSQVIQTFTNDELLGGSQEIIPYFKIKYKNSNGSLQDLSRTDKPGHHIAAFTALTPDGLRYNYGIPAYNLYQEETTFSARKQNGQTSKVDVGNNGQSDPFYGHSDTEKFLKKMEIPPYAHSYLLTSIVGPDYVDITGDGVSFDDLGYWVKFTYTRTASAADAYKWRDPYSKAHLQEGWKTDPRDDKGSYVYGEKEVWYLSQAETKSHITTFTLQERQDARGVAQKLQDANNAGKPLYALQEIKLFTRAAGSTHPIKVVKFEYDYSQCPGVYNSNTGGGKLTLKKLWFEYGGSQRGKLNPYIFTYHATNPSYDQHAYDRWGNYKPYPAGQYLHNVDYPYVVQDPSQKGSLDNNAAAWSIKEIRLPSGGKVIIDYETDDYAYVQHMPAMQMMEVVDPYGPATQAENNTSFELDSASTKVRFKLEQKISGTLTADQQREEVLKYIDQKRKQVYFKLKINLRSAGEGFYEYISGYADIAIDRTMALEKDNSGKYAYGSFFLVAEDGYHPFSMRAWQHLRTNQPELANSGRKLKQASGAGERVDQIKSLGSVFTQIRQMFEGFYKFCNNKDWGKEIVSGKSWIRLNSPDKIKYGGGLRVRQITMTDNWAEKAEGIYGQVYEYTMEENGKLISSGVAAYEPLIGGDENPLRYAKKYVQAVPLRSDNNLFFEYPINESYYPGPQIGYRKVTVHSLASASLAGKDVKNAMLPDGSSVFPKGTGVSYGTTGVTVHEFYTAKDFPVITDETEKQNKPYKLSVPIPFLGNVSISKLAASQGYSIVTNDMHGKPRQVSTYRQNQNGVLDKEPVSWVRYNYVSESKLYQQQNVQVLNAWFKDNGDGTLSLASAGEVQNPGIPKYTLAQENEFFIDMRQYQDVTWEGGARINTDIVYIPILFAIIPIPVPTVWPSISRSESQLKTAVTNKVVFKSGILESTEAFDGGSLIKTSNVKWDKLTGTVVLTKANNNYNNAVYNYTIPAYQQYAGMGAAYQNVGTGFVMTGVLAMPYREKQYKFSTSLPESAMFPGDELVLYTGTEGLSNPVATAVYIGVEGGEKIIFSETPLTDTEFRAMILRSGFRNQLNVSAGSITALQDPSIPGQSTVFSKRITIPKGK